MKILGFTLIELMVTIAVVSILLSVGVPQYKSITANNRLTSSINQFSGDLAFARTEAVKRGKNVTITAVNAGNWSQGWKISSAGSDLRITPAMGGGTTMKATADASSVAFRANGRLSTSTITFKLCDSRAGGVGKRVTLATTGQAYLETNITCP